MMVDFKTSPYDLLEVIEALSTNNNEKEFVDILVTKQEDDLVVTAERISLEASYGNHEK